MSTSHPDIDDLKREAFSLATSIIGRTPPESHTSEAAVRVMAISLEQYRNLVSGDPEDAASVGDLADKLREIIRRDPDGARQWVVALEFVNYIHDKLINPRCWKPNPEQKARARAFLGKGIRHIEFAKDGRLIARASGGDFMEVPAENPES